MLIRKLYRFEGGHAVRNADSERCKYTMHGHSFVVEVILKGKGLSHCGMLYDFGLMKGSIKEFLDAFDHCYFFCNKESEEFKKFIKKFNKRWIELPFSPSAEQLALYFHVVIQYILDHTKMSNGEDYVGVHAVRVHETATGYAESEEEDAATFKAFLLTHPIQFGNFSTDIFSKNSTVQALKYSLNDPDGVVWENPETEQQFESEQKDLRLPVDLPFPPEDPVLEAYMIPEFEGEEN